MENRSSIWRASGQWIGQLNDFIMRLRAIEVNVEPRGTVPAGSWLARLYLWACELLYSDLAWWYDRVSWLVSGGQWRRWQAAIWEHIYGENVLELGFGTGELLVQGRQRGLAMTGLDRSPAMQEVARHRIAGARTQAMLIQGDGRSLPLTSQSFDTVMATFPAGYILAEETLTEIHRVLRSEGRVVILGLWVELHLGMLGSWLPVFYGRPNSRSLDMLVDRVESVGFRARWVGKREGLFTVGILVADKIA
jgi:SAM-dependent methyltransferase